MSNHILVLYTISSHSSLLLYFRPFLFDRRHYTAGWDCGTSPHTEGCRSPAIHLPRARVCRSLSRSYYSVTKGKSSSSYFLLIGRKIGCDKSLPVCNNCARTGRKCMGYGVRLTWPDSPDGRRKLPILPAQTDHNCHSRPRHPPSDYYGQQFLNVTTDDVEKSRRDAGILALAVYSNPLYPRPKPSLTLLPEFRGRESDLMLYCKFSYCKAVL